MEFANIFLYFPHLSDSYIYIGMVSYKIIKKNLGKKNEILLLFIVQLLLFIIYCNFVYERCLNPFCL